VHPLSRSAPTTRHGSTTTSGPRIVDKTATGAVGDGGNSGSPWPALVAVALVAALGAGAFATVRTRRRRSV
jgi:hypothetical protein